MLLTWDNYRTHLPESLHEKFRELANNARRRAIIYTGGVLRYAFADEY